VESDARVAQFRASLSAPPQAGEHCPRCGRVLRHAVHESMLLCPSAVCAYTGPYYASLSTVPGFAEEPDAPGSIAERVKPFKAKLAQHSADRPEIAPRIWHAVHAEHRRNALLSAHQIKPTFVEQILEALGCAPEVVACSTYVANALAGQETAVFQRDECDLLAQMYLEFKTAFLKLRRKTAAKFPKHNYLMHQFCMVRHWFDRAQTFPLLKDRRTLEEADRDFSPVAKALRWEFFRSI
jgi:Poxvirus Late Transcription Factor VLTF3 like